MEQANSIKEYLMKIERYKNLSGVFYRGQSEEYQNVTSSLSRDQGFIQNEHAFFQESIKMKPIEFDGLSAPIEYLSKMQHYGIPTRLIDLTIDPLIALYFAVQNSNSTSAGNVYIFIQPEHSLRDKEVKLLALLAMIDSYDIEKVAASFLKEYKENISNEEIIKYASDSAFIEHTDELKNLNIRLFSQRGTFAICGNFVKDELIKYSIKPLDDINPNMIVRIPYEHKYSVKKELDEKHNINETIVYPEFSSVADYLKDKYKQRNFRPDGTYSIHETKKSQNYGADRISIYAVLNKELRIDEIKQVGLGIIEQNKVKNDVVWVYIAKNGDDYIMKNWIIRGQWIKPTTDSKKKPFEIGPADENNCHWSYEKSYSTLSDYYSEYAFDDDITLYVYHMKVFKEIQPLYTEMLTIFNTNNLGLLRSIANEYGRIISNAYFMFGDFGFSRNDVFNEYLKNYQEFASQLDNVIIWLNKEELNDKNKYYQVSICFREAQKYHDRIVEYASQWTKVIGLTDSDYIKIDPKNYKKKEYQYKQTLPLNPKALDIWFKCEIFKNADYTINISGTTNLFDKASLMISIRDSKGYLLGQSKSDVKEGKYDFGLFTRSGEGYPEGVYEANISLSIPNVQNEEFINKAGIEYENLTGEYVDRNGFGPVVNYYKKFNI